LCFQTSAVEIERVCNKAHEAVLETAAIGVQGPNGGPDQLVIVAVLKKGNQIGLDELQKIFSLVVSSKLNPLFKVLVYSVQCYKHTCACLIFIVTCDKLKTSLSCWWS
jgi:acyl-coenzyme A synthetase/AMP-(fatty) acid ligase